MSVNKVKQVLEKFASEQKQDKLFVSWNEVSQEEKRSTGSLLLDDLLGGGYVPGSISQWMGQPSGGKTSVVTHICAEYQRQGKLVAYLDCENSFDPSHALHTFGFNVMDETTVLFSQEENASNVYEMVEVCAENGFSLVVIDSTDAMFTNAEQEGEYGDAHMGQMARMNSQALKKLKGILKKNKCDLMMISQVRTSIGGYTSGMEVTSGGKAIEFYSSIRNRVAKVEIIKDKEGNAIGQRLKITNKKNKTGIPFKEIEMDLYYNKGLDTFGEYIELGIKYGLIEKKGGWFNYPTFPNDKPIQGKENVIEYFKQNEKEYLTLKKEVLDHFNGSAKEGKPTFLPIEEKKEEKKRTRNVKTEEKQEENK